MTEPVDKMAKYILTQPVRAGEILEVTTELVSNEPDREQGRDGAEQAGKPELEKDPAQEPRPTGAYVKNEDGTSQLRAFPPGLIDQHPPQAGDFWIVSADGVTTICTEAAFRTQYVHVPPQVPGATNPA